MRKLLGKWSGRRKPGPAAGLESILAYSLTSS